MANLLNGVVYVSLQDARDTSSILSNTWSPTNAQLTQLITEAQWTIDNYIQSFWERLVDSQSFIFPTVEDWIPDDIQLATVWVTEQLFLEGKSLATLKGEKVTSESNMSRSVSYSDNESYNSYVETIGIPKKVLNILNKYKNDFIWQVI